jgi:hypothetical protein
LSLSTEGQEYEMRTRTLRACLLAITIVVSAASICCGLQVTLRADEVAVITNPSDQCEGRVLVKYSMPSVLTSAQIIYAQITGEVEALGDLGEAAVEIEAAPISTPWSPAGVSWTGPWNTAGGDIDSSLTRPFLVGTGTHRIRIDLTDLVRQWATDDRDNFGVLLKTSEGFGGTFVLPAGQDGQDPVRPPTLRVWYLPRRD